MDFLKIGNGQITVGKYFIVINACINQIREKKEVKRNMKEKNKTKRNNPHSPRFGP